MTDKSWLLNHSAITAAKKCIAIIEDELGIRLKLSHPQFLEMIKEYTVLNESSKLETAYLELLKYSEGYESESPTLGRDQKIVNIKPDQKEHLSEETNAPVVKETVEYNGRTFPMFNDEGLRFKGLYRGQPRYA